jgi:hypothetical protein
MLEGDALSPLMDPRVMDGRQSATAWSVARGTGRFLASHGFSVVRELSLLSGRRADLVALSASGEIWIVEIKSSLEDLRADRKWRDYRAHCDRLVFAAPPDLDIGVFPSDTGFIRADAHGAEMLREAPEHKLAPATRKAVTLRFAGAAATQLHRLWDPGLSNLEV